MLGSSGLHKAFLGFVGQVNFMGLGAHAGVLARP